MKDTITMAKLAKYHGERPAVVPAAAANATVHFGDRLGSNAPANVGLANVDTQEAAIERIKRARAGAGAWIDPTSPLAPADVRAAAEAKAVRMGTTITLRHDHLKRVDTRHGTLRLYDGQAVSNGQRAQRLANPRAQEPLYNQITAAIADIAALREALDESEAALLAHRDEECPGVTMELLDTIAEELRAKVAEAKRMEMEKAARAEAEKYVRDEEAARVAEAEADREALRKAETEARYNVILARMTEEG